MSWLLPLFLTAFAIFICIAAYSNRLVKSPKRFTEALDSLNMPYERRGPVLSRLSASLQLAFRPATKLHFANSAKWAVGQFTSESEGRGQLLTVVMYYMQHQSPHMYFDYKANNSWLRSTFPQMLDNAQLVYYEGFVSDRFALYAPTGYEIDSLVIAAPDVLDVIMREHQGADVEVIGDQLYLIFPGRFDLRSLGQVIASAEKIAAAIDDNVSRYDDDRTPEADTIATAGRRLTKN